MAAPNGIPKGEEGTESPVEDEEEDEPRLKYQRLGSSVAELLAKDAASCLCVSDKMLALGTHDGSVHVLDYSGNEVKRYGGHKATVNDICFDLTAEYIASCADDGSVRVHSLYKEEVARFKYTRPIKTVALDPRYGTRKTHEFIVGGMAGQLILNQKGWLGNYDNVIHMGEGAIHIARWAGNLIAWANDLGVKVYDTSVHKRVAKIERPKTSMKHDHLKCHLFWEDERLLYIGWYNDIKVARARTTEAGAVLEIVAAFQMDFLIAGISPFGEDMALLAYIADPGEAPPADGEALRPELKIVTWRNEELASDALSISGFEHYQANDYALAAFYPRRQRMVDSGGIGAAAGALPGAVAGAAAGAAAGAVGAAGSAVAVSSSGSQQQQQEQQNPLQQQPEASTSGGGASVNGGSGGGGGGGFGDSGDFKKWWADGDEPLYYIVSPKDIVVGRPRDGNDRVAWLLEHGRFDRALAIVESDRTLKAATREKVAEQYLEHLLKERKYEEAAALVPRLLKEDASAWERWVYLFAQLRQLPALAPHMPTERPRLRATAYEMVLHSFLLAPPDHPRLRDLVLRWPQHLYNIQALTEATLQRMRGPGGDSEALLQVAAALYRLQGRHDLALAIYLRLGQPDVFDYIAQHNLLPALQERVAQLMAIDEVRACSLLVERHEEVAPAQVLASLDRARGAARQAGDDKQADLWRRRMHHYLDWLFQRDQNAGADFHGLQVELYADYEPARLMMFLVSSQQYPLEHAYEVCEARGMVREQVFILGRMGAAHRALHLIIQRLADIPQAIEFVQMQRDDELWELLISLALGSPELTGSLLDHIGGYVNPLRLIQQIPNGMAIPGLRDRLVHIIADFRTQTSLRQGYNTILHHDCITLAQRLYREVRHSLRSLHARQPPAPGTTSATNSGGGGSGGGGSGSGSGGGGGSGGGDQWFAYDAVSGRRTPAGLPDLPGPWGGRQLVVRQKGAAADRDAEMPKVWVGLGGTALVQTEQLAGSSGTGGHARSAGQQHRRAGRRKAADDAKPPLASLIQSQYSS